MPPAVSTVEELLFIAAAALPVGHASAIRAPDLAADLGVSERMVRVIVAELCDRGYLVGSVTSGDRPGYFMVADLADLNVGTAHLRSRALAMLARYRAVRTNAFERFGPEALRLFDLEEVEFSG